MTTEPDKSLTLEVEESEATAVVYVRGSVTIADAETLQSRLEELTNRKIPTIILDLSQMDFICSTGLGAIIVGHLKTRHYSGRVRLVNPVPAVHQLLETTRLTKLLPIYPSIADAAKP